MNCALNEGNAPFYGASRKRRNENDLDDHKLVFCLMYLRLSFDHGSRRRALSGGNFGSHQGPWLVVPFKNFLYHFPEV